MILMNPESNTNDENKYKLITRRIDYGKIRHKNRKDLEVSVNSCKKLNVNLEGSFRSGAIIYIHMAGKTYFCLGIDAIHRELTDFGGGVKKDETIIEGGLRELYEESQGVFGDLLYNDIKDCIIFNSHNMAIMFIHLQVDMNQITKTFFEKIKDKAELEVSSIKWLETNELTDSIQGRGYKMYNRVSKFLNKVLPDIKSL